MKIKCSWRLSENNLTWLFLRGARTGSAVSTSGPKGTLVNGLEASKVNSQRHLWTSISWVGCKTRFWCSNRFWVLRSSTEFWTAGLLNNFGVNSIYWMTPWGIGFKQNFPVLLTMKLCLWETSGIGISWNKVWKTALDWPLGHKKGATQTQKKGLRDRNSEDRFGLWELPMLIVPSRLIF